MATYIGIKGIEIQTIAGDPANPIEGQVWYNTTANTMKGYGLQGTGAWSSGGDVNTQRSFPAGCGLLTAALMTQGYRSSPGAAIDLTELYDGTAWTEVNSQLNPGEGSGGFGTQTAACCAGSSDLPKLQNEDWDGTCWTAGGATSVARYQSSSAGTQTAGMVSTGDLTVGGPGTTAATEEYNGSSWSAGNNCNTARNGSVSGGTQTAALMAGGGPTGLTAAETYDGTSWTNIAGVVSRNAGYGTSNGSTEAFLDATGRNTTAGIPTADVEEYDGSTWTEIANVSAANQAGVGMGTAYAMLKATGSNPVSVACEEYAIPLATKTFTSS